MSYENDIECGKELADDIASGLIDETQLLPAGQRKLKAYRDSGVKKSVTELLLEDEDE